MIPQRITTQIKAIGLNVEKLFSEAKRKPSIKRKKNIQEKMDILLILISAFKVDIISAKPKRIMEKAQP
jgi:hypothetical protein